MKMINKRFFFILVGILLNGCVVHLGAHSGGEQDLDSIFGGISVDANATVRDISSVNGSVRLGKNSHAGHVDVVNGAIEIGESVSLQSVETVNGAIEAKDNVQIEQNASTVNGSIEFQQGSHIAGSVETVNGDISLSGVQVGGNLKTTNGNIKLVAGTQVDGDLIVEVSDGWFSGWMGDDALEIEIDERSSIRGNILLDKPVTLRISPNARVGKIIKRYDLK